MSFMYREMFYSPFWIKHKDMLPTVKTKDTKCVTHSFIINK